MTEISPRERDLAQVVPLSGRRSYGAVSPVRSRNRIVSMCLDVALWAVVGGTGSTVSAWHFDCSHGTPMEQVAIIGGGFAGTAFAVHLSRTAPRPLDIVLVEPRAHLGCGLAYSTLGPDHRLNAPDTVHPLYPSDEHHFRTWLESTRRLAADPEARHSDGRLYPRRCDFGAYLTAQAAVHAMTNPSNSRLIHCHDVATGIEPRHGRLSIELAEGKPMAVDRCVIATGHEPATIPIPGVTSAMPGVVITEPFAPEALAAIEKHAEVLVLGTGLTSADAVASLMRQGHLGLVTCISRHGQRPQDQKPPSSGSPLWERICVQPPKFIARHGNPDSVRAVWRSVQQRVHELEARSLPWHDAVDEIRDAAGEIWSALPTPEKRRFLRHVKPYYDSHRFRVPPQTRDIVGAAEARGQLRFRTGRIIRAKVAGDGVEVVTRWRGGHHDTHVYGAIVCCVGFSPRVDRTQNPLLRSALQGGLLRPSDIGRSPEIDSSCRAVPATGAVGNQVCLLGALTLDHCGETPAAIFILRQVTRMLPAFVGTL